MPAGTYMIHFNGHIWTPGTWDGGETFTVTMRDQYGHTLATVTKPGAGREEHPVSLSSSYNQVVNGDVEVRITNTLDEAPDNESIGWGDLNFGYEFDP